MKSARTVAALILIIIGVLILIYGGFNYTKETHESELGPLKLQVQEKDRVELPAWIGIGGIALGTVLLLIRPRKT